MKKLSKKEAVKHLQMIIWDYDIDVDDLYDVLFKKKEKAGHFDFNKVFIRMLERLFWYDLLAITGIDFIRENLTSEIIKKIRIVKLREKYEYLRQILSGESVSLSGWSVEYRESIKDTLLSNRWYSTL